VTKVHPKTTDTPNRYGYPTTPKDLDFEIQ